MGNSNESTVVTWRFVVSILVTGLIGLSTLAWHNVTSQVESQARDHIAIVGTLGGLDARMQAQERNWAEFKATMDSAASERRRLEVNQQQVLENQATILRLLRSR
jgi:hypothetical protein